MATQLNVLFMALGSRAGWRGTAPIYGRLLYNKEQVLSAAGCKAPLQRWHQVRQRAKGNTPEAEALNQSLK